MIYNKPDSRKQLQDLSLLRWENEGGALCPSTMTERFEMVTANVDSRSTRIEPIPNGYRIEENRPMLVHGKRRPQRSPLPRASFTTVARQS